MLWYKQASDGVQPLLIRFECCLSAQCTQPAQLHKCWTESRTQKPIEGKNCIQNYFKNFLLRYIPCNCCSTFHNCPFQYCLLLARKVDPYPFLLSIYDVDIFLCVHPLLPRTRRRALKMWSQYFYLSILQLTCLICLFSTFICLNMYAVAKKQEAPTHRLSLQRRLLFQLGDTKSINALNALWTHETRLWGALVCVWGNTTNET